jgi:hypothetical protein
MAFKRLNHDQTVHPNEYKEMQSFNKKRLEPVIPLNSINLTILFDQ